MSREIRISVNISAAKGNGKFQPPPMSFTDDIADYSGPTPGAVLVSPSGTDVDVSLLSSPGWCRVYNADDTQWVQLGIYEPDTDTFYPLMRFGPGQGTVIPLDPYVGQEVTGSTVQPGYNSTIRLRSQTSEVLFVMEALNR